MLVRSLFGAALLLGLSSSAWATPVTSYPTVLFDASGTAVPGKITATLDLYTRPYGDGGFGCCSTQGPARLVDQFSLGLGSDFWVHIPQIADPHASWEMSIPTGSLGISGWPLPGLNQLAQTFPGGTDVASLSEWCSPGPRFVDGIFLIARRGTCTFVDKVANIQTANGVGAVIVNNVPGAGAMGMAFVGFTPVIPVLSVSYERGEQIMAALIATGADSTPDLVYLDFAARWDPDPVPPVPEPASLLLLGTGAAGLIAKARRRTRQS